MSRRSRPVHADPYVPRGARPGSTGVPLDADAPAPATAATARTAYHRRDAVPGTVGATSRVTVSERTGSPRLRPLVDTVPLRTDEFASTRRHGIRHTAIMDRDGFVRDVRAFGDAPNVSDAGTIGERIALGASDMRNACDVDTMPDGTVRHIDGDGRWVRTTADADTLRLPMRRVPARRPRATAATAATAARADRPDRTPPARVSSEIVDMYIRARGWAGPIDARMRTLARDAMAHQRALDAYAD